MNRNQLNQLIKESIQEYIREIDKKGNEAAVRAKMEACEEAIASRNKKIEMSESLEEMKDMVDPAKIKTLKSEIKTLEKSLKKYQKQLEKMEGKMADRSEESEEKEVVTEDEPVTEVDLDMNEEETMSEQILYMQKLAGILTEDEFLEAKNKLSAGLTKKQKSAVAKKAHKGRDIGKEGPGFEKVAKAVEKQYGSKEAGQKVAAASELKESLYEAFNPFLDTEEGGYMREYIDDVVEDSMGEPESLDLNYRSDFDIAFDLALTKLKKDQPQLDFNAIEANKESFFHT